MDDNTTYGRAWRSKQRITVENIQEDPAFEPYRATAEKAGYMAVQSTPFISRNGTFLGILSTHYRQPCSLSIRDEQLLDLIARQTADLFERLNAEQVLETRVQERTSQVQTLASQLTLAEHDERARIAQILHDDLQQQLYSLQIQLISLRDNISDKDLQRQVQQIYKELEIALQTTRRLSIDLSPPILEGEGLIEAVNWLSKQMKEQYGLEVTLEAEETLQIPNRDQLVLLFQSIRELLFNTVKHAGTSHVGVNLQQQDGAYRIEVHDGGVGFDPKIIEEFGATNGRGLRYIRNRLHLIGGTMAVESAPGKGVRIVITTPLNKSRSFAAEE
jgi:signal transduction histidine kinase